MGYATGLSFRARSHSLAFRYSSTDADFRSFGNPYLETAKNELEAVLESRWPKNLTLTADGSVYKVFTDSAPGNSGRAGAGLAWRSGWLQSLAVRFDYTTRPYQTYRYQGRSLCASAAAALWRTRLAHSYSYTSSSMDKAVQSHTAGLEISRPLYRQLLAVALGHQYYQLRDNAGSSDQDKNTSYLHASGTLGSKLAYELAARRIEMTDRIDPAKCYQQNVLSLTLARKF
jgi:hypothetical protein